MSHSTLPETHFDILSPAFLSNPYPLYDWLRANAPVHRIDLPGQRGWVVTRYKDVSGILRDPRFIKRIAIPTDKEHVAPFAKLQRNMMLFLNPPNHTRLRTIANKAFTPRVIGGLRTTVLETVDYLIQQMKNTGEIDIIADFAFPFPVMVIASMLGVPDRDRDSFRSWTNSLIQSIDLTRKNEHIDKGTSASMELVTYFRGLIRRRQRQPQNDVISHLIAAKEQGENLSDDELLSTCILLLIAGHETTVNLIGNGLLSLLKNETQFRRLRENPELITTATEELLRYESPTQMTVRFAREDVEIGGELIRKGSQVNIFMGAANRDSEIFRNAGELDISRNPNPHLSFGHGIHFCLGASLARLEGQIGLLRLVQSFPDMKLASDVEEWRGLIGFRGLKNLKVSW